MKNKRVAGVDVGTNSALLTIARVSADQRLEVLFERAVITRLGEGLGPRGALSDAAMERTLNVLEEFGAALADADAVAEVRARAVGTSALRRAVNGAQFLERACSALGLPLEILSGEEEARIGFLGATNELPGLESAADPIMVDPGGGSTEVVDGASLRVSLEIGAVRLTEAFLHTDPPTEAELEALAHKVRDVVRGLPRAGHRPLIGVGGTATTLAALDLGLERYDSARVHGHQIELSEMVALRQRLAALPLREREQIPCLPRGRADVAVAGALILEGLLDQLGCERMLVSDRGLRFGLMAELIRSSSPSPRPARSSRR